MLTRRQKRKREEAVLEEANSTNEFLPDERNPLLNDVVLGCLFKMSTLSDLMRFRLVSKQWYSLTLARCRQEMTVVIRPPTYEAAFKNAGIETETVSGPEWALLERKLDVGDQPFRSYRLFNDQTFKNPSNCVLILYAPIPPGDNSLRMLNLHWPLFFSKFGSSIHKLELCGPFYSNSEARGVNLHAIFEETPNLEKLILNDIRRKRRMDDEGGELRIQPNLKYFVFKRSSLPISWNCFFRHFPNIQLIDCTLDFWCVEMETELLSPLTEISQELNNNNNLTFFCSSLTLRPRLLADNLPAMRILQLPLLTFEKLIIGEFEHPTRFAHGELRQLISTALRYHGNTLKELELIVHRPEIVDWFDDFPFHSGPFISLTTLKLRGKFYKNLRFFGEFPNVNTLKIIDYEFDPGSMDRRRMNSAVENIRVFHFSTKCRIPDDVMTIWVDLMPNVEDFAGVLSDSSLRIVCDKWSKLKRLLIGSQKLRLMETSISDEGITGIVAEMDERLPNITDLQDLESLVILKPEKMSDASIWNGFLKLPRLKNLSVQLSEETSGEAFQALTKKFPADEIIRCVRE